MRVCQLWDMLNIGFDIKIIFIEQVSFILKLKLCRNIQQIKNSNPKKQQIIILSQNQNSNQYQGRSHCSISTFQINLQLLSTPYFNHNLTQLPTIDNLVSQFRSLFQKPQHNTKMHKQASSDFTSPQTPSKNHNLFKFNTPLAKTHLLEKLPSNTQKNTLKCGIESKYLGPIHYQSTCQFAKKRNILYKLYLSTIRDYYSYFNMVSDKFIQKVTPHPQKYEKLAFLQQFKSFINQFGGIFKQVSLVQISYFQNLEDDTSRRQYSLEWNTNQFIDKLQKYKKSQNQFEQKYKVYTNDVQEIYQKYESLKKDEKDPYCYFNRKNSSKKAIDLIQNLKKQSKTRENLQKDLDEVYRNSSQFQNNLIFYRQHLFNNKYKVMKKLTEVSKISRNSLTQFMVYLFQSTSKKSQNFNKFVKSSHHSSFQKKSKSFPHNQDKLAIQSYLIQVSNQYHRMIDQIQATIRKVSDIFEELRKFTTSQTQSKKKILELMNTLYDVDQNPQNQVSKTLNFYQEFCTKIFQITNGLNIATNELAKLKKEARKLSEITLSLVRNSKISQKGIDTNFNEPLHNTQIQILLEKLSYDYPVNLIQNIYKDFQKNLTHLKNDASQKFHMKKRRILDSMEISHLDEQTLVQPKKRICKKQVWLWEKWQNQLNYKIDQSKITNLTQILQFTNKFIIQIPEANENDRFSCTLQTKGQPMGFFILTDKYFKFQTSQANYILIILLEEIEDVKIVIKMFGKVISINTINGPIELRGFIDPQKVFDAIQELRNNSGVPVVKAPRSVIEVTEEQLAFMDERKKKIKNQLPNVQDFQFIIEAVIEGIPIDYFYELIYSEKEVNIRGKVQPNFFAYTSKKNGASNYQFTKYDSIGPRFYTHQQGVTFLNCPLSSMRIINYDVKLPPIPFMPKYAHNRQECKLFWISHQEFYYLIHNNTSGAPKSDTFYLEVLHRIQKVDQKNTKISFFLKIVFTEDSYLKSTIMSSASSESKRGMSQTLADIKKYCRLARALNQENNSPDEVIQKQESNQQLPIISSRNNGIMNNFIQALKSFTNNILFSNQTQETKKTENKKQRTELPSNKQKGNLSVLILVLTFVLLLNLIAHIFTPSK